MNKMFMLCALLLATLAGCSTTQVLNTLTTDTGYSVAANLVYDSAYDLRLDVYSPSNVQNAPVVVFFYGGRWENGSKDQYKFVGQALSSQGFVAVVADYRKYPQVRYPAFIQDGANAVRWVHDNISSYGGDPSKLFVMGHDSGAYISAMLALNESYLKAVGGSRAWLKGMIGLAGPYDFLPINAPDLRDVFSPPDQFAQTQPIMYADGRNPPLLLMTGMDDDSVLPKNSQRLAQEVVRAGGTVETVFYPQMSHSMILASIAAPLRGKSDVLAQIADFVRRRAVAPPPSAPASGPQAPTDEIQVQPLQTSAPQPEAPPPTLPQPVPVNPAAPAPVPAPAPAQ